MTDCDATPQGACNVGPLGIIAGAEGAPHGLWTFGSKAHALPQL